MVAGKLGVHLGGTAPAPKGSIRVPNHATLPEKAVSQEAEEMITAINELFF